MLTPVSASSSVIAISTIDMVTMAPSSWFHVSAQYGIQPMPNSLRPISTMNTYVMPSPSARVSDAHHAGCPTYGMHITPRLSTTSAVDTLPTGSEFMNRPSGGISPPPTALPLPAVPSLLLPASAGRSRASAYSSAPAAGSGRLSGGPLCAAFSTVLASSALSAALASCVRMNSSKMAARKRLTRKRPPSTATATK